MSRTHHVAPLRTPPAMARRRRVRLAVAAGALAVVLFAGPAIAQETTSPEGPTDPSTTSTTQPNGLGDPDDEADEPLPPLGELPEIAPELADVELTSDTYDLVAEQRDAIATDREEALALMADKESEIDTLTARDRTLTRQIDLTTRRLNRLTGEEERLQELVRAVAVDSYIHGSGKDLMPLLEMDPKAHDDQATAAVFSGEVTERHLRELSEARVQVRRTRNRLGLDTDDRAQVRAELSNARDTRDQAEADAERLATELIDATIAVEGERRMATVVDTEFPLVVLDAYFKGAQLMKYLVPTCGIEWWALAGIGRIESRHGTYGGAEVRADGSLTRKIIGIPLTGSNGTAAIGDSDGGLIDGDPTVDRAAGPMQFIPQTWVRWGHDGNGDGEIEIQNLYDAAASAAAYLCASGPMTDTAGLQRGYFSYNRSSQYVYDVLSGAVRYGTDIVIEGVTPPPPMPAPPTPPAPTPDPADPVDGETPVDGSTPVAPDGSQPPTADLPAPDQSDGVQPAG